MHVLHLLAVEAEDWQEAKDEAENFLAAYGDGDVWDYYSFGGRWTGVFAPDAEVVEFSEGTGIASEEDHPGNMLRYNDDPEQFRKAVEAMLANRDEAFRTIRDRLNGRTITAESVPDSFFGYQVPDPEYTARAISEDNRKTQELFTRLLDLEELPRHFDQDLSLLGHHIWKLGHLVAGYYCFDAYFWDASARSAWPNHLWERIQSQPDTQWLVAVDLHN